MNKKFILSIFTLILILLLSTEKISFAEGVQDISITNRNSISNQLLSMKEKPIIIDPNKPLGDVSSIKKSVYQFENYFHKVVMLPQYIPFTPTHSGGNLSKKDKLIQIDYLNQKINERLYLMILLRPEEKVRDGKNAKKLSLVDGTEVIYNHIKESDSDFIRFKKGDLIYYIAISKNKKEEKLADLLKVANSLK